MGGKGKKYQNRKKNKQESKQQEKKVSVPEKPLENVKNVSMDDVEMKNEVMSTHDSDWDVERLGEDSKLDDFEEENVSKIPEELVERRKENDIKKSEVRKDHDEKPKKNEQSKKEEEEIRRKRHNSHSNSSYEGTKHENRERDTRKNEHRSNEGRKGDGYYKSDYKEPTKPHGNRGWKDDENRSHRNEDRSDKDCSFDEKPKKEEKHRNDNLDKSDSDFYNARKPRNEQRYGDYSRTSSSSRDREYNEWDNKYKNVVTEKDTNVIEVTGDLFCADDEYALGHCVAEDMNMGSGIATEFRSKFKNVSELLEQRKKQGDVATLHLDGRYIYYLVTKRCSNGKPTYETLFRSLRKMKIHAENNGVKKIALPRIGCGLDNLEWKTVKSMLQFIFKEVEIEIKIYNFQQNHGKTKQKLQTKKEKNETKSAKKSNKKKR